MYYIYIVAAGPIGRNAEASGTASLKSVAAVYSYSKTRGLFAGVSLEGSVIIERFDANAKMYGRKVSSRDLLNGTIPPPPQADSLYRALDTRFHNRSTVGNYSYGGGTGLNRSATTGGRFAFMDGSNNSNRDNFNNNDSGYGGYSGYSGSGGGGGGLGRSNTMYNNQPVYGETFVDKDASNFGRGDAGGAYGGGYGSSRGFDDTPTPPVSRHSNEARARALFNFSGEQDGDLPFRKGDIITVTKKSETQHDWYDHNFILFCFRYI